MATVFDGDNLIITLDAPTAGVLALDIERLYSEWKEWQLEAFQNIGFPPAFRGTGGDAINATLDGIPTFFLRNDFGWRLRPFDADQTINIEGQLAPQDPDLPLVIATVSGFTVIGFGVQPIAQAVSGGVTLTSSERTAITQDIMTYVIEAGFTFEEILRLVGAMAAGDITQAVDGSYTITGLDGTTARILGDLAANNGRDITAVDAS